MARGGAPADQNGVRKKTRANSMGLQWWRKLTLPRRGKKSSLLAPQPFPPLQLAQIEQRVSTLKKATAAPRATRAKGLATAHWDRASGRAQVATTRGGSIQSMGEFVQGVQWLYPEEALYLVDRGVLDCCVDGLPMSVQHMWSVAFGTRDVVSVEEYLTYAHLRRAGWVVRRADKGAQQAGGLRLSFAVWRVGGFRRKDQGRPMFYVSVHALGSPIAELADVTRFLDGLEKSRLKIAAVDRGIVVLLDVASNATPLSERYVRRLPLEARDAARQLKEGDVDALIASLDASREKARGGNAENVNGNLNGDDTCLQKQDSAGA